MWEDDGTCGSAAEAQAVERGCGKRKQGGVYIECGLSPVGEPLEHFIMDPPVRLPAGMPISPIGVSVVQRAGAFHVVDWVGAEFYPNVADFLEEVRRFGLSRRVPKNFDFATLSGVTRIILVHPRAWVENVADYRLRALSEGLRIGAPVWTCPKNDAGHLALAEDPGRMCAGAWWQDVTDWESREERVPFGADGPYPRGVVRAMPSFRYFAHARPEGFEPQHAPAFFASFPISRVVVVKADDGSHEETFRRMQAAGVPVAIVDE